MNWVYSMNPTGSVTDFKCNQRAGPLALADVAAVNLRAKELHAPWASLTLDPTDHRWFVTVVSI